MSDTPITDRRAFFADNRVGNTVLVVETETARQLERMCNELHKRLNNARDSVALEINEHLNIFGTSYPNKNAYRVELERELEAIDAVLEEYKAMKEGK